MMAATFKEKPKGKKPIKIKTIAAASPKVQSVMKPPPAAIQQTPKKKTAPPAAIAAAPQVVQTPKQPAPPQVAAAPKQPATIPVKAAPIAAKSSIKPASKSIVKPTVQKKPAPKAAAQVEQQVIPAHLLEELEKTISKIEAPTYAPTSKKSGPARPVFDLKIDHFENDDDEVESGYQEMLIGSLSDFLDLPEFGEVKIKLTLQNNGKFVKMNVLNTKSVKNRKYLEEELPKMHFPLFFGELALQKEHTFVITFCNRT